MFKVITLIDNIVYKNALFAENGLALLIEYNNQKIIFDTGQTDNFIKNAKYLNINLNDIDSVVISHGHYDHVGGLIKFCEVNSKAKIYIKREAINKKYSNKTRYTGFPFDISSISERFYYIDKNFSLNENISIISNIVIKDQTTANFENMFIKQNNCFVRDNFEDELFLILKSNNGINIITGCSHRGIINIIETALEFSKCTILSLIGGFHLKNANQENKQKVIDYLNSKDIDLIVLSHCTGVNMYEQMKSCAKEVHINQVGKEYILI